MRAVEVSAALLIALGTSGAPAMAQPRPSGPAPGILVSVGGHKLHVRCLGPAEASPTVVLEAGGGGHSSVWPSVQELLAPRVRTCAYDRAGSGWSEPGPAPRSMSQEAFELHALLDAAKIPRPLVLVGHSIGGLIARTYTERHGNDVAGVVLVDPTHESGVVYSTRAGGWVRLREQGKGRAVPEPKREGKPSAQYNPDEDYLPEEFQQLHLSRTANREPLGSRPLIVLAAGRRPPPPGTPEEQYKPMRQERDEQVRDLAGLSRNSKFVLDPSSGHGIPADNPQLVARAIEEVVTAVRQRARLVP
jgi:pimeloyl-ACP methyl ester carboxylesterase